MKRKLLIIGLIVLAMAAIVAAIFIYDKAAHTYNGFRFDYNGVDELEKDISKGVDPSTKTVFLKDCKVVNYLGEKCIEMGDDTYIVLEDYYKNHKTDEPMIIRIDYHSESAVKMFGSYWYTAKVLDIEHELEMAEEYKKFVKELSK